MIKYKCEFVITQTRASHVYCTRIEALSCAFLTITFEIEAYSLISAKAQSL